MFKGDELPLEIFAQRMISPTDSFPLLAVPFYTLAGVIMNHAGITRRLMGLADALVGHLHGALAQVNVLLATLMGGLSASANADAAMQAKMVGPEMIRRGYTPAFAAAITACAAVITPIIPPGIGFIIYGFIADVSIGRLFLGGVVPGLMVCVFLMLTVHVIAKRRGYKPQRTSMPPAREVRTAFVDALGALSIALFIVVGIRYGIFTPTEAGALAVLYAVFVGAVWHRELKLSHAYPILLEATLATSVIMLIICCASAFGYYMTWERIPPKIAAWIVSLTREPAILLLIINLLLIVVGMLIEGTAALILLTPILVPVVTKLGVDPAGRNADVHDLGDPARAARQVHARGAAVPRGHVPRPVPHHLHPRPGSLAAQLGVRLSLARAGRASCQGCPRPRACRCSTCCTMRQWGSICRACRSGTRRRASPRPRSAPWASSPSWRGSRPARSSAAGSTATARRGRSAPRSTG
jgi:tripartite ATP-independent transporter DctM subunit